MYSPNKPYTVYCHDCWFSDKWNPVDCGRDYDPEKSFFGQFEDLWKEIPKLSLIYVRSVNSEYVNISADNKNCYMIVESSNNENCTHCYWIQECKDLIDVSFSHKTELSYESDDCYGSYRLFYSKGCENCNDGYFLLDCRGCSDCIGCVNLRQKKYCIWNEQKTKAEYEKFLAEAGLDTYNGVQEMGKKFREFIAVQPRKFAEIVMAPGCSGNYINNAKSCRYCFHCYDAENSKYGVHIWRNAKDCVDCDTAGRGAEMIYNSMNCGIDTANYICSSTCWTCTFMSYSFYCFDSNNCFGSIGLRNKNRCILNKQYDKDSYDRLKNRIIEDMKKRGEYGEFFPADVSTFGYNESAAIEQFPLIKDEAADKGYKWEDYPRGTYGKETVSWDKIPDSIKDIGDLDVPGQVFSCLNCKKNYLIIPNEFDFYKKLEIPLPRFCPDCRHSRRFTARGPNRLWKSNCRCGGEAAEGGGYRNTVKHFHGSRHCSNEFETPYSSDRKEIVYCEQCYQSEVA